VRKPGGDLEVWYNGRRVWSYASHYPVQPENVMFDITNAYPGRRADLIVAWFRVWSFQ
jgi:hypothetical protein